AQNSKFEEARASTSSTDIVTAFNIRWRDSSERVRGTYVSSGFFRTLGVQPLFGRAFLPEEDRLRDHRAAILSHSYWRTRFGADLSVLGNTIAVDTFRGCVSTIVAVLPAT